MFPGQQLALSRWWCYSWEAGADPRSVLTGGPAPKQLNLKRWEDVDLNLHQHSRRCSPLYSLLCDDGEGAALILSQYILKRPDKTNKLT